MSWKIVPDSAADFQQDYKPKSEAAFEEVPLSITVENKNFIDDQNLDIREMVDAIDESAIASTTACPSPNAFREAFEKDDADKIIAVTLSHNLSGSYNSAQVAKQMTLEKFPEKQIEIIDSMGTGGTELLLVEKADELIAQGKSFDEVVSELNEYRDSLETLFTLGRFENLIKNGRLNYFVGKFARTFNIRIIGKGTDGKLDILYKVRGEAKAIKKLVEQMGKLKDMKDVNVIILDVFNKPGAIVTKRLIEKTYPDVGNISIYQAGGINSYYAEEEGLIVSF